MVFFKRWSRKNYAVFNSLKREIKICIVSVCLHTNAPALIRKEFQFLKHSEDYPPEKDDEFIWEDIELLQLMPSSTLSNVLVESPSFILRKLLCYTKTSISLKPPPRNKFSNHITSWILFNDFNYRQGALLSLFL